jgi:hypothetical protein
MAHLQGGRIYVKSKMRQLSTVCSLTHQDETNGQSFALSRLKTISIPPQWTAATFALDMEALPVGLTNIVEWMTGRCSRPYETPLRTLERPSISRSPR